MMLIESCVDSVESSVASERGGAGRLELCAALGDAGTTPSAGMIRAVKAQVRIPVFVIVRPRGGGFVYTDVETDVMRRDIEVARESGADGIAVGALTAEAQIDVVRMRSLVEAAKGLPVTCHRAFDFSANLDQALDALMDVGVSRVLTSGGVQSALDGADIIASLRERAGDRLVVMAGGGIRDNNAAEVVGRTGVTEIHIRPTRVLRTEMARSSPIHLRKALPVDDGAWEEIDEARVRAVAAAVKQAG